MNERMNECSIEYPIDYSMELKRIHYSQIVLSWSSKAAFHPGSVCLECGHVGHAE